MSNEQKPWWRTQKGIVTISTVVLAVMAILGYFSGANKLSFNQISVGIGNSNINVQNERSSTSDEK